MYVYIHIQFFFWKQVLVAIMLLDTAMEPKKSYLARKHPKSLLMGLMAPSKEHTAFVNAFNATS